MFSNRVAVIVGAGASNELGFPLGSDLKTRLQEVLDIRFSRYDSQHTGDNDIVEALRKIVKDNGERDINPYLQGGWAIRDAMPTTSSIDSFLQTHIGSKELVTIGKLGIARCILKAEKASPIRIERGGERIDLASAEKTWYADLFKLLAGDLRDPASIFKNLTIVSFNYDRSLEHYLYHALMSRFLISKETAQLIMRSLEIYHPYGAVGCLPWQDAHGAVPYGGSDYWTDLITGTANLRTFSEGVEDGHISKIRERLKLARSVLIVGLGYAPINMNLLNLGPDLDLKSVYATAFGIDPTESVRLQNLIGGTLAAHNGNVHVYIDCTSKALFSRCQITFASL